MCAIPAIDLKDFMCERLQREIMVKPDIFSDCLF